MPALEVLEYAVHCCVSCRSLKLGLYAAEDVAATSSTRTGYFQPKIISTIAKQSMGDYNFSINSNVRSLSPLEFHQNTNNSSLFFTDHKVPSHTMQDELLLEKPAVKQQQLSSSNAETNTEQNLNDYSTRKSKDEETNSGSVQSDKKNEPTNVTSPLHLGFTTEPNAAITSTSTSYWSTAEDTFIQGMQPALNGTLAFQNFPPNANPPPPPPPALFNVSASLGPQIQIPQHQPQRRPLTVSNHNFPHASAVPRQATAAAHSNLFVPSSTKTYSTNWNNPQPATTTWSAGPPNQAGLSPWSSLHQRRPIPNVSPISSLKKTSLGQQSAALMISPSRFRRSTSFPAKNYPPHPGNVAPNLPFEMTGAEDNRDVTSLLPFQVNK